MKYRPVGIFLGSTGLAGGLVVYLCARAGLDPAAAAGLFSRLEPESFVEVVILLGINSFLAGERWRLTDRRLAGDDYHMMPRTAYFAWTALGVGFGQILPTQVSLALCRSAALRLHHGRGLLRGAAETVFEQSFDILVAGFVGVGSILAIATGGEAITWIGSVLAAFGIGIVLCMVGCRVLERLTRLMIVRADIGPTNRVGNVLAALNQSGLLSPAITLRLLALSVARFVVLALLAAISAQAISLNCPLWQLAATQPFAVFGNALAITPGGLGINEWATASALFAFGVPFQLAAQWAVVNRALVAFAALCGATIGVLILVMPRWSSSLMPGERRRWKSI